MTVSSDNPKVTIDGNDMATVFGFDFAIFADADLKVVHTDAYDKETPLAQGVDYTVAVTAYPGTGSITYPVSGDPLPEGEKLTLYRELTAEQQTDLNKQKAYYPDTLEAALDRIVMLVQQAEELLSRVPRLPVSDTSNIGLDLPVPVEGRYLRYGAGKIEAAALAMADGSASDTTPRPVSGTAGATGSAADYAREDHEHLLPDGVVTTAKLADDAVETTKVKDDAVTLAKLAHAAHGDLLLYGAGGAPSALAIGADGTVLKSDGTTAAWGQAGPVVQTIIAKVGYENGSSETIPRDTSTPLASEGRALVPTNANKITPKYDASKVKIDFSCSAFVSTAGTPLIFAFFRGTTCIGVAEATPNSAKEGVSFYASVLDEPNTVSQVEYQVNVGTPDGSGFAINQNTDIPTSYGWKMSENSLFVMTELAI